MTEAQNSRLEKVIGILREDSVKICEDPNYSNAQLMAMLYSKGFSFIQKFDEQNLVDMGVIGLALLLRIAK